MVEKLRYWAGYVLLWLMEKIDPEGLNEAVHNVAEDIVERSIRDVITNPEKREALLALVAQQLHHEGIDEVHIHAGSIGNATRH